MKIALVVQDDLLLSSKLQEQLKFLGFTTFVAATQNSAMNIAKVCGIAVILISTPTRPHDRRSFAGELKSALRSATVILITECDDTYAHAMSLRYSGLSGVLKGPSTVTALWRVLEHGREGFGCHPGWVPESADRRRRG